MLHVLLEFHGIALAELVQTCLQLFLFNIFVFFVLVLTREILPRERASEEVDDHMSNRLQVIPSRLFFSQMCSQRGIPSSSRQIFTLDEWNVLALRILVAFGQTKINNVNVVASCISSN